MTDIVGIDLGTTHSLIGVVEAGFPILLADAEGRRLTPSAVSLADPDAPVVGWPALRMKAVQPRQTVLQVKRLMGRRFGDADLDPSLPLAEGRAGEPLALEISGRRYTPENISALILGKLKTDAQTAMGRNFDRAVITVPAYFNDGQRQATKLAGEHAGFTVERILNEPTAAALAYGLDKLGDRSRVAVYDFGGGTFDLSILELEGGVFRVLSTHGNTRLGGEDINLRVAAWAVGEMRQRDLPEPDAMQQARLMTEVEAAKIKLSTEETALLQLPFAGGDRHLELELTRQKFEALAGPVVEPTRRHCRQALHDAGLQAADLDQVVLVGGSTRLPMVRRLVEEIFEKPPHLGQHPDEAIATGATLQAGILSGAVQEMVLLDVTPLSLGLETVGGLMNVIIPRNTTIPTKAGEAFTTLRDGQTSMRIKVLQGEREMARDNWPLGEFEISFAAGPRGSARVGVQFEIDANGILHVLARDLATGRDQIMEIKSAVDVSDEAVEAMISESIEHAFDDMGERVFTEAKLKAEEMLPAVEKALETVGDSLEKKERREIDDRLREVRDAMESGVANRLKQAVQSLDESTQTLATLMIQKAYRDRQSRPNNQ